MSSMMKGFHNTWWHPWSTSMPPPHSSSSFNPRAYDTVAPWAYESMPYHPVSRSHGNFSALSPIERDMWNIKSNMDRLLQSHYDQSFSPELTYHASRPASMLEHQSLLNPVRTDANGNRWLSCYFDLRSFKPEEITVTLESKDRYVSVEAHHEIKDSKEHYVKRNYSRRIYIPDDIKVDLSTVDVKAILTNDGMLCIEANLPKMTIEEARTQAAKPYQTTAQTLANAYKVSVKTV